MADKTSFFFFFSVCTDGITTLQWWYGLCVPVTPRAMSAGVLRLLAGTPMPNRSKGRDQTGPPGLGVGQRADNPLP